MCQQHYTIPDTLQQTIKNVYGEIGKQWLVQLPSLLKTLVKQWNFQIEKECENLSFNFTALVILADGGKAVLKCSVPSGDFAAEIGALQSYAGVGAVKLIAADAKSGWLLEERCIPGDNLLSLNDDEKATTIALNLMSQLWHSPKPQVKFPTLADWLRGLDKLQEYSSVNPQVFPKELIEFALITSKSLLASSGEQVLLHGDIHHGNILSNTRNTWLAIDPKGVLGEREYEVATFMRNPVPQLLTTMDTRRVILRRLDQIVERMGFDHERILLWSIVHAVLAAWWCIEDKTPGKEYLLAYTQILYSCI